MMCPSILFLVGLVSLFLSLVCFNFSRQNKIRSLLQSKDEEIESLQEKLVIYELAFAHNLTPSQAKDFRTIVDYALSKGEQYRPRSTHRLWEGADCRVRQAFKAWQEQEKEKQTS